jgi:hypothetical protein
MDPICVTRALKNARFIQSVAPHIIPAEEPPEGFASLVPLDILSRIHQMSDAELQAHPQVLDVGRNLRATIASSGGGGGGLFNGVLHFVQVTFNVGGTTFSVPTADIDTMVQYAVLAAEPISAYASQYGPNQLGVSTVVLQFSVDVPSGKYNDHDLQGWVNTILTQNNLQAGSSAIIIANPRGVANTDGDATKGTLGYHSKANCPYSFVNVFGTGFTIADLPDTQAADHYVLALSHELAEMTVDPNVDGSNPEVCDPCGPNCGRVWRDFFSGPPINAYMQTSQLWPPNFPYGFFLNAIVQPGSASKCPAPQAACDYAPPAPWNLDFPAESAGHAELGFQGSPAVFPTNAAANKKAIYAITTDGRLAQLWDTDRWNLDFPAEGAGQAGLRFQNGPAVFPTNAAADKKAIYVVTTDGRLAQLWDTD